MKKHIYLLLALLFVNPGAFAQDGRNGYLFTPDILDAPREGGIMQTTLACISQNWTLIEVLKNLPTRVISYTNDPQLISVVSNGKAEFHFEFRRNTTGKPINRSVTVTFECEEMDFTIFRPIMVQRQAIIHYTQATSLATLKGGIIECDTSRIYKMGDLPPMITSKEAASSIPIIINGQVILIHPESISYTWERKTISNPIWQTIPGETGPTCRPSVMDDLIVYYRRKAVGGPDMAHSNIIALGAHMKPGVIAYELSPGRSGLTLYHMTDPSALWEQTAFELSADLKTWSTLVADRSTITIDLPEQTTYYRNVVTDKDGNKYYSNIISFTPRPIDPYLSKNQNYINTRIYKDNDRWMDQIQYFDGLGRLSQRVDVSASPAGGDLVTPIAYDAMGRGDAKSYLPYASSMSTGEYQPDVFGDQAEYYRNNYNDAMPYAEKTYESSPLNRVIAQMNVGEVFRNADKKSQLSYLTNTAEDCVVRFAIDHVTSKLTVSYYDGAKLYKNVTTNEDGTTSIHFVDMLDRTLLERVVGDGNTNHDTYHVYDDFGRLAWVLPPQAVAELQANALSSLSIAHDIAQGYCYIYRYDGRNRCIERKLPGKEWEYLIYDRANRLVLTQDGNLRQQNRWIYNVYDNLNRPMLTSLVEQQTAQARQEIQDRYNANGCGSYGPMQSDTCTPFDDNTFSVVAALTESKYGGNSIIPLQSAPARVIISEIFYNSGSYQSIASESASAISEFIEFYNCDSIEVDMSGWELTGSDATEVFVFPGGTRIPAGGHIILSLEYANSLLVLGEQIEGSTARLDKQIIYQQKVILGDSDEQLTLKDAAGNIRDAIFINASPSKPLNPLNPDAPIHYMSRQRIYAQFDINNYAVTDRSHWESRYITPFSQQSQFATNEDSSFPIYLRPKLISEILDISTFDTRITGLKVYDKIAILTDNSDDMSYIERAYYYDYKGRIVQTVEKNQFGGISRTSSKYDLIGNVVASQESHQPNPQSNVVDVLKTYNTYNFRGHLLNQTTILNDCKPEIIHYGYDELGRLKSRTYGQKIVDKTIEVSPYQWFRYTPGVNEVSDHFRDYLAEKMINLYDVQDWEQYDYILADGRVNPDYFASKEGDADYYYFPNIRDEYFDYLQEDIIQPFKEEYGMSTTCYDATDSPPTSVPLNSIVLKKEVATTETYNYNIQGWQTEQHVTQGDNPLFASQLYYYNPQLQSSTASYIGNISEWTWCHGADGVEQTYAFDYDRLSRLADSRQFTNNDLADSHVEQGLSYDGNGNIRTLRRTIQGAPAQQYGYTYSGNQLVGLSCADAPTPMMAAARSTIVTPGGTINPGGPGIIDWPINPGTPGGPIDPTIPPGETINPGIPIGPIDPTNPDIIIIPGNPNPDPTPNPAPDPETPPVVAPTPADTLYTGNTFLYDHNGNMVYDAHQGLNLRYNSLNLLKKVMRGETTLANYSYLSDGTKLSALDSNGNGLIYAGSLVYAKQNGTIGLESASFSGGRIVALQTSGIVSYEPRYFVSDHLGSVRTVIDARGEELERSDYYPFGMRWTNADAAISDNRHRYNGKEEQGFLNIPYSDYGARMYDSKLGRWFGGDPLAEKRMKNSPYAFCSNNPITRIDPNGMLDDEYYNEKGQKIHDTGVGNKTFVVKTSDKNIKGGAPILPKAADETEQKIARGVLKGDHMQNVVEIAPISTLKTAKAAIRDDGTGSHPRKPDNQRETGGNILQDNSIANVTQGPMRGSNGRQNASVDVPANSESKATFHSHPSATFMVNGEPYGSAKQPSPGDYSLAGNKTNYIFQMNTQSILIYNNINVIATLPFSVLK